MSHRLLSSESVTSGHPDKLCDAISDSILDACLRVDPNARVAVETLVKGTDAQSHIVLAGEVTLDGDAPDYASVARAAAARDRVHGSRHRHGCHLRGAVHLDDAHHDASGSHRSGCESRGSLTRRR